MIKVPRLTKGQVAERRLFLESRPPALAVRYMTAAEADGINRQRPLSVHGARHYSYEPAGLGNGADDPVRSAQILKCLTES